MRKISLLLVFLLAPLLGVALGFSRGIPDVSIHKEDLLLPVTSLEKHLLHYEDKVRALESGIGFIQENLEAQQRQYELQQRLLRQLAQKSQAQKVLSDEIYEQKILRKLGTPFDTFRSDRVEIKLFRINGDNYRGYAAKVKLFDSRVMQVVLAKDTLGEKETTSEAVARTGAIFGVNGGGFYRAVQDGEEKLLPIGNTVIAGDLVGGFTPTHDDLFFSGWTKRGILIGGLYTEEEELLATKPWYGVSFVPILFDDGRPLPIPEKWQRERHPRTVIGQYANGDFLFLVIDGRRSGWSEGISIESLQLKLYELGIVEAYNLDGGGSSTFVFNGKVLNRPSDGKERPVATNIVVFP